MWSQGFDKNSGPGTATPKQQNPSFGNRPPPQSQSWFNSAPLKAEGNQRPAVPTVVPSRYPATEFPAKTQVQDLKRTRSPPPIATYKAVLQNSTTAVGSHPVPQITKSPPRNLPGQQFGSSSETKRPSVSPPRLIKGHNSHVWTPPFVDLDKPEEPATNQTDLPVSKRSRLPFPVDPGLRGNDSSVHDDTERELQAKAKRLARFRDELSQPEPSDTGNRNQKQQQADQLANNNLQTDGEDQASSAVIIGYCPDMCPEQERAERERKGDLDQYERLDGDRNHTTESLAVKKYTRTAEREAALIRPMEILQKTMGYLLNLLNQPYDDKFLGLYNFLWDRMRAIRMDLRMQHIFNLGAITMLEQMIRLHIIAMHELCEYTKGEGFSEGFDAHLNIEQMNKTSVELFQLYDDHRKKGTEVPTEREFRGYYALLKLDKHPGYKVEPSELSLDLAKMTPGIRQTAEVLFARDVARACRTGNFIAFFRLVRKASYLQACLMHAHFGKLRTQALAALYSGLQNNQGIPVSQVAKWLGMEEENMEDLLGYHGFSIKEFEEPYMVKERQFLNPDNEYPLRCSRIVHLKRSTSVVDDVLYSSLMKSLPSKIPKRVLVDVQPGSPVVHKEKPHIFPKPIDTHIADNNGGFSSVKNDMPVQPMEFASPSPRDMLKTSNSFKSAQLFSTSVVKPSYDKRYRNSLEKHGKSNLTATQPPQVPSEKMVVETLPDVQMDSCVEDLTVHPVFVVDMEPEETKSEVQEVDNEIQVDDQEVAEAKLKLIFRLWRRRASIQKDLRYKKQLAANAALSSLSLGPPMRHHKEQSKVVVDFNIDRAMCERYERQEKLWSRLNVSDVVAPTLGERNKYPKCVIWKLLFCCLDPEHGSEVSNLDLGSWLRYKLMPGYIKNDRDDDDDDLVASLSGMSIWKKWDYGKSSSDLTCYLSVVKNVRFGNSLEDETVVGSSAVMFVSSESISWEAQKLQLHNLVSLIPCGSCLPLLILIKSCSNPLTIVGYLGLNEVDKSKICSFSVIPLAQKKHIDGVFNDGYLRKGLEWLASQSPVQPVVCCVKTRELVLTHLKKLVRFDARKTSPGQCISAINQTLDESIKEIDEAAKSNPVCWPCPEILLLQNKPVFQILKSYLPNIGWSSSTRIQPLIQALQTCKLPTIPNEISWHPNRSLGNGIDVENQRLELEDFLVSYLSPLMGLPLAQKEASTLIQNCVGLELHGSTYYLVPKWFIIFRRVLNWQLMSLSSDAFATSYILEQQYSYSRFDSQSFEDESDNNPTTLPSLDEMIQVSSNMELDYKLLEPAVCDPPKVEMVVNEKDIDSDSKDIDSEEVDYVEENKEENDRSLSRLLEKCNIMQDIIDKKLSIYF